MLLGIIVKLRGYAQKLQLVAISAPIAFSTCHSLNLKGSTDSSTERTGVLVIFIE